MPPFVLTSNGFTLFPWGVLRVFTLYYREVKQTRIEIDYIVETVNWIIDKYVALYSELAQTLDA